MTDVGEALRAAYNASLEGVVTIGATPVPFVDEKLETNIANANFYVLFLDQIEDEGQPNKTHFVNETFLRMRIVNRRKSTNTKEIVEDIANQILTALFPNRTTWNVSLSSPLKLTYARYVDGNYNPVSQSPDGLTISKTLTFKNRITQ
jgi:hypothetical protein